MERSELIAKTKEAFNTLNYLLNESMELLPEEEEVLGEFYENISEKVENAEYEYSQFLS